MTTKKAVLSLKRQGMNEVDVFTKLREDGFTQKNGKPIQLGTVKFHYRGYEKRAKVRAAKRASRRPAVARAIPVQTAWSTMKYILAAPDLNAHEKIRIASALTATMV